MTIQLEFWQMVTLLGSFVAFAIGAGKVLLAQIDRRLDQRFTVLEEAASSWRQVERDILTLKAELPLHYVRREDYVRNQTVIEAKLDALAVRIENMQLREVKT